MGNPIEEPMENTANTTNSHFNSNKIIKTIQIDHKGYYNVVDGATSGGSSGGSSSDTASTGYGFDVHLTFVGMQFSGDGSVEPTFPDGFHPALTILYYHPHSSSMVFDSTFLSETVSDSVPTHMVTFGVTPLNTIHSEAPIIGNLLTMSSFQSIANEYGFTSDGFKLLPSDNYVGCRVNGEIICDEYALYSNEYDNIFYNIFLNTPTVQNDLDYTEVFEPFIIESDDGNRSYQFDLNLSMASMVVDPNTNTPGAKIETLQVFHVICPIPTNIDDSPTS